MPLPHRDTVVLAATIALVAWGNTVLGEPEEAPLCPIGFELAYTELKDPYCLLLKGPEAFEDLFENCAGNLYTSQLYFSLNVTRPNVDLWSGYKSLYPGGIFIDWSFTDTTGSYLASTYEVRFNSELGLDEELCVIINHETNFTAARCNKKHHRYCIVRPYSDVDVTRSGGCRKPGHRFWSPMPTCLTLVTDTGGETVNWRQGQDLCLKRGDALLQRGWRYANNPLLRIEGTIWSYPLGIEKTSENNFKLVNGEDANDLVSAEANWILKTATLSRESRVVALLSGTWHLVLNNPLFDNVVCERSIHLYNVSLNVTVVE